MDTGWYLTQISQTSNRLGDKLMLLMNTYNKNCLRDITLDEAREFYEKFIMKNE